VSEGKKAESKNGKSAKKEDSDIGESGQDSEDELKFLKS
jgi:hypothetical protein